VESAPVSLHRRRLGYGLVTVVNVALTVAMVSVVVYSARLPVADVCLTWTVSPGSMVPGVLTHGLLFFLNWPS
jgi:hypothetical protein